MCVDRMGPCFMLVLEYVHIACMFGKCIMGYEYFIDSIDICFDFSL